MKQAILFLTVAALTISGCATKRYGRLQPLTVAESEAYDCRALDIEIAKVEAFREQVSDGARFNGASAMVSWVTLGSATQAKRIQLSKPPISG